MKKMIAFVAASVLLAACGRSPVQPTHVVNPPLPPATYGVAGTVSEATGDGPRRLVAATVAVGNDVENLTASTDEDGQFSLEGLSAGSWQLSVSKDGYETQTMMLDIPTHEAINVELKPAAN